MLGFEYEVSINGEPVEVLRNIIPMEGQRAILRKLVENLGDLMFSFRDPRLFWYVGICQQTIDYKTKLADIVTEPTYGVGNYKRQLWNTEMDSNSYTSLAAREQVQGPIKTFQAGAGTQFDRIVNRFFLTTAVETYRGIILSASNTLVTPVQVTDTTILSVRPSFSFLT